MFSVMANCFTWLKSRKEPIKKITILMIGLDNAGKTTTVADLKDDTREGITPTLGFLTSSFNMQRFNVTVFDLGGGRKIRGIWASYYAEIYGMVYVVDASDRDKMEECRTVLHETKQNARISGKPLLILANKQDVPGAMTEQEVYSSLDLGSLIAKHKCPCQVFTSTAYLAQGNKVDKQIKKGFRWLLSEITKDFSSISQRVERDMAEQKRINQVQRKEKLERVRRIREERERAEQEAAERAKRLAEESDDDDLVVGGGKDKSSRKSTPTPASETSTPEKKKKKKKKKTKKVVKDTSLDAVDEDNDSPARVSEPVESNELHRRLEPLEDSLPGSSRLGRLAPLESPRHDNTEEREVKKKKKKKKRRTNKTAPMDEPDETHELPPLSAWGTPPGTLNGFPGSNKGKAGRLEPLGTSHFPDSSYGGPSIQDSDEELRPLGPIKSKSWNRTRPNSEDHDVMT